MNVIQSYFTTIMRGDFSVYEIRIFIKIVECANGVLKGINYSNLIGKAVCADGLNCNLSVPIRSILPENSNDYEQVKMALKRLASKHIEFYSAEKKTWYYTPFISNVRVADGDGMIKFTVAKWLIEYIINFVNCNYNEYNMEMALSLTSAYAVRMYWLTCNMDHELTYSIDMLREMLGVGSKYKATKDFIKRCIKPSADMLAARKLNGFSFATVMKKGKTVAITLHPIRREEIGKKSVTARANVKTWCAPQLYQYLTQQVLMTSRELSAHKDVLFEFSRLENWQDTLIKISRRAQKIRAGKGYYFAAMKSAVDESGTHSGKRGKADFAEVAKQIAAKSQK